MGSSYEVERTDAAIPLGLVVVAGVAGVPGLVPTLSIRDATTTSSYLDFADGNFKTSGWITKSVNLGEVGGGRYTYLFDLASLGLASGAKLAAEYEVVDPVAGGIDADELLVVEKLAEIDLLRAYATNRLEVAGGNPGIMTLYANDGTTVLKVHQLRDPTSGPVANVAGSAAKRSAAM